MTRALLELPESVMSKLIVLEDNEKYLEYLKVNYILPVGFNASHALTALRTG